MRGDAAELAAASTRAGSGPPSTSHTIGGWYRSTSSHTHRLLFCRVRVSVCLPPCLSQLAHTRLFCGWCCQWFFQTHTTFIISSSPLAHSHTRFRRCGGSVFAKPPERCVVAHACARVCGMFAAHVHGSWVGKNHEAHFQKTQLRACQASRLHLDSSCFSCCSPLTFFRRPTRTRSPLAPTFRKSSSCSAMCRTPPSRRHEFSRYAWLLPPRYRTCIGSYVSPC